MLFPNCDLTHDGSFDEAIKGCATVIHTASPFFLMNNTDGIKHLVEPAVEGTRTIMEACHRFKVKKVVLTSSTAAVYVCYGSKSAEHIFSSEDWSDENVLLEHQNYYSLSKVKAEKLAWELAAKYSLKLAVMNPCLIWGPQLKGQNHLNT